MTVKYAIKNHETQQYTLVDTADEAASLISKYALTRYIDFECQGNICSMVKINEDCTEEWYTQTGESQINPTTVKYYMHEQLRPLVPAKDTPLIPVVTL